MKLVHAIVLIAAALVLTACNFTLASDITPPPDYVSPTPMPTLGALVPPAPPDVQQGAAVYAEKCAACHGEKGLGDGPQSMQLPVTVPGIGLNEVARQASPAQWYKIVTQGNLDRFMPPFVGALSDQQRWDVVAYAMSLHAGNPQLAEGKQLFEANCPGCAASFSNQARMASLSEVDLVKLIKSGEGDVPAFGKSYTDDQAYAVAAYLRTLTYAAGAELASGSTPAVTGTPEAAATPAAGTPGTPQPAPTGGTASASNTGNITGTVQMGSGGPVPANLNVTLHGFDHAQDQSSGPQEVLTLTAAAASDGSYTFAGVGMPPNRIFLADVEYGGLKYRSSFAAVQPNASTLSLPAVKLYEKTTDFSALKLNQVHIYTDFATAGSAQVLEIFAFTNSSDRAVIISDDGSTIPFIKLPANAQDVGYEAGQDSAPFIAADKGLAAVPSDTPYSIIAFFTLPYDKKLEISQPVTLDTTSIVLLIPDGMKVGDGQLTDRGLQVIQNNNYHEYASADLKAGQSLDFSISGSPRTSSATGLDARQITMIAGGSLGLLLILAGALLYWRDRRRAPQTADGSGFETPEEVMDAILALDDLHRTGKIADDIYRQRRADLKDLLKQLQ